MKKSFTPNEDKGAESTKRFCPTEAERVFLVGSLLSRPKSKDGQQVAGDVAEHVNCIALDCQRPRQVTTQTFTYLCITLRGLTLDIMKGAPAKHTRNRKLKPIASFSLLDALLLASLEGSSPWQ